ncbi:MAG TPA: biopolymer transporter ExbD [Woeseiaceae bacterium]|nr:biopolymer transporter ExbD [Woeseiaceae bacterium]
MQKSQRAKRMEKRHRRAKSSAGGLHLVSLMDIFTILVFFLLVNSGEVETLPSTKDVQLPESVAEEKPEVNVVVLVSEEQILVQGEPVAAVTDVLSQPGVEIPALREALLRQNRRALDGGDASDEAIASREVTIMGDRDIPYRLLKKVMATCTAADYGRISLAVMQKSSDQLEQLTAAR